VLRRRMLVGRDTDWLLGFNAGRIEMFSDTPYTIIGSLDASNVRDFYPFIVEGECPIYLVVIRVLILYCRIWRL
jgi:hypothetical protein